jgi:hypothetical protein
VAARNESGRIVPLLSEDDEALKENVRKFVTDARTVGSVRHPHLVRVVRLFEANGSAYLVTEHEPGLSLLEWLTAHGRPDPGIVALWLGTLADALASLHTAGILHGGIQPARIRIRTDKTPVLLDYSVGHIPPDRFRAEMLIVSPGFTPLEQYWDDGPRGPWTDLYSLAAVGYWLITGERTVEAPARVSGVAMTRLGEHPRRGKSSAAMLAAIDEALNLDPARRPQNALEWRRSMLPEVGDNNARFAASAAPPVISPVPVATATGWPPARERVDAVQAELSTHIGPIAALVVKRAYGRSTDWRTFCNLVANEIPDATTHAGFLARFADPDVKGSSGTAAVVTFANDMVSGLESELAKHIGAIARVVVKRAAKRAASKEELYSLLGSEITDSQRARSFIAWAETRYGRV